MLQRLGVDGQAKDGVGRVEFKGGICLPPFVNECSADCDDAGARQGPCTAEYVPEKRAQENGGGLEGLVPRRRDDGRSSGCGVGRDDEARKFAVLARSECISIKRNEGGGVEGKEI